MLRCPYCGTDNKPGLRFCEGCRSDLRGVSAESPALFSTDGSNSTADSPSTVDMRLETLGPLTNDATDPAHSTDAQHTVRLRPATLNRPADAVAVNGEKRLQLVVLRGVKPDVIYRLYEGRNYIGRRDERPVDIDLEEQESAEKVWTSRQHAVITLEHGKLVIEDLNSLNGTLVNRVAVTPGQPRSLAVNDIIQIGTIHLKVTM